MKTTIAKRANGKRTLINIGTDKRSWIGRLTAISFALIAS